MKGLFYQFFEPLVDLISDDQLKNVLRCSVSDKISSIQKMEQCFAHFPNHAWSKEFLALFFNSWKATHLKMLAIYGLCCRLQRLALSSENLVQHQLFLAATYNAETSHEDLGLDFQGITHTQLYDHLAKFFLGDFPWQLDQYCLPSAQAFKNWTYHNMVVQDIANGLLTNLFSEMYNHCEYSIALSYFSQFVDQYYPCSEINKDQALSYIKVHVMNETEIDHFLVVFKALETYNQATHQTVNYQQAYLIFTEYLDRVGQVMETLSIRMQQDINRVHC